MMSLPYSLGISCWPFTVRPRNVNKSSNRIFLKKAVRNRFFVHIEISNPKKPTAINHCGHDAKIIHLDSYAFSGGVVWQFPSKRAHSQIVAWRILILFLFYIGELECRHTHLPANSIVSKHFNYLVQLNFICLVSIEYANIINGK